MIHAIIYDKETGEIRRIMTRNIDPKKWNITTYIMKDGEAVLLIDAMPLLSQPGKMHRVDVDKQIIIEVDNLNYVIPIDVNAEIKKLKKRITGLENKVKLNEG